MDVFTQLSSRNAVINTVEMHTGGEVSIHRDPADTGLNDTAASPPGLSWGATQPLRGRPCWIREATLERNSTRSGKCTQIKTQFMVEYCSPALGRLMREPRGHKEMYGAMIVPDTELTLSGEADVGVLFCHNGEYMREDLALTLTH